MMEASVATDISQQQVRASVRGMKGWLKFLGIMMIIAGALQALTIVGILWAWLPIWMGVILNQAGGRAQGYLDRGDTAAMAEFLGKLKTYFVMMGILLIISLALSIIATIAGLALGIFAGALPSLMQQYGLGS
jgi:hypothetical protein